MKLVLGALMFVGTVASSIDGNGITSAPHQQLSSQVGSQYPVQDFMTEGFFAHLNKTQKVRSNVKQKIAFVGAVGLTLAGTGVYYWQLYQLGDAIVRP